MYLLAASSSLSNVQFLCVHVLVVLYSVHTFSTTAIFCLYEKGWQDKYFIHLLSLFEDLANNPLQKYVNFLFHHYWPFQLKDNYFEEALKMRNLLEEFSQDHGKFKPSILGVREHVFTGRCYFSTIWLCIFFDSPSQNNIFSSVVFPPWPHLCQVRKLVLWH